MCERVHTYTGTDPDTYTHTPPGSPQQSWEEKKDKEKNSRYNSSMVFINEVTLGSAKLTASQINFTFGVRGTIRRDNFFKKLLKLGVEEARHREEIRKKVGRKMLQMHDLMLKSYYQVKFNLTKEIEPLQTATIEKQSRAIQHKIYLSVIHSAN
jgi:hypothetical protein